jgi:hypothetical protein
MAGTAIRGEAHGNAKLTARAVRQIRILHAQGCTSAQLGERFGVSSDAVRDVVRGRTWTHIT